jgi:hypothetical protein
MTKNGLAHEIPDSPAARFDTLTKGRSLMFHSGQTQPSNEVCAMLADKE